MSKLQAAFGDEIIHIEQKNAFWMKGFLNAKTGIVLLTQDRVAFMEKKMIVGGGLIGAVAGEALNITKPKLKADIPLDTIASWSNPKKNDILIETKDGGKFKFRPVKFVEWDSKLKELTGK